MRASILLFLGSCAVPISRAAAASVSTSSCKCLPTDSCWPSTAEWDALNSTVGGRLIATVPLATDCHDPNFDNATCSTLQEYWINATTHINDPSSIMAPFFANQSCDPYTPRAQPCRHGNYARYAVDVAGADDVAAAVAFARERNIRLVIRNTGHDYLGRSTGAGSLSIWTQHLKDIEIMDWDGAGSGDGGYVGKAARVGAGVQGWEILEALTGEGYVAITGECPTVGIAGGYSQGGGHSMLSTMFGLGADQVLEWEVVTVDGRVLRASASENSDLYWALCGGGPGNYAVVLSMTVKIYADAQIGGASLQFNAADMSASTFWAAVNAFHSETAAMVDAGVMMVYFLTTSSFRLASVSAYNQTADDVRGILAPYVKTLNSMNATYTVSFDTSATYYEHYDTYFGPLPLGVIEVGVAQYGGRLVPRSTFQGSNSSALADTVRFIVEEHGVTWVGVALDVSGGASVGANAVHPAWRDALMHVVLSTDWSFDPDDWSLMLDRQRLMTDTIMPAIEAITPGSGAYMNEADFRQPDFEEAFFGSNYDDLLSIKQKYDPDGFLYVTKGVGSDRWTVANDGRMCKASGEEAGLAGGNADVRMQRTLSPRRHAQ